MRRRIIVVALSAVALAMVLLGIPLGVAISRNAVTEERSQLERAALFAATAVSPSYQSGDAVELPAVPGPITISLYTPAGQLVTGPGGQRMPDNLAPSRSGAVTDLDTAATFGVALPVSVNERVVAVIFASAPRAGVNHSILRQLLELAGLGAIALLGSALFAWWQARRLAAPLLRLAETASAMGDGDFAVRARRSGVREIDATAQALADTSEALVSHIDRERWFAAHASHQLRTPLTRLMLELEAGLAADPSEHATTLMRASASAEHLSRTVDDVLSVARTEGVPRRRAEIEPVLMDLSAAWRGPLGTRDRPLRLHIEPGLVVAASEAGVRQIVQVLLDNAYTHGSGTVTLAARARGEVVAVDLIDQGTCSVPWPPTEGAASAMGLRLARSLAEAEGGRLLLADAEHETRFTLLLPLAQSADG